MKKLLTIFLATFALALNAQQWTGTWGTAAEFTGPGDMPQKTTLDNTSVRQIVHVSLGGDCLRLQLSNEFSAQPVEIKSVYIADAKDSCDIDRKTARMLRFEGQYNTTIQPGKTIWSDPIKYNLKPLQLLSITVCYGSQVPVNATSHRGSRTTSYIAKGTTSPRLMYPQMDAKPSLFWVIVLLTAAEQPPISRTAGQILWQKHLSPLILPEY